MLVREKIIPQKGSSYWQRFLQLFEKTVTIFSQTFYEKFSLYQAEEEESSLVNITLLGT